MLFFIPLFAGFACADAPNGGVSSQADAVSGLASETPASVIVAGVTPAATDSSLETLDLPGLASSLRELGSYRLETVYSFEGTDSAGQLFDWQMSGDIARTGEGPDRQYHLSFEGLDGVDQPDSIFVGQFGSQAYLSVSGVGCIVGNAGDFDVSIPDIADPDRILAGLSGARFVAAGETIDGLTVRHFEFDERALPIWRGQPVRVDGHVFVAEGRGHVVRVTLEAVGQGDFLGVGDDQAGTFHFEVNVRDVDMPLNINLPADCLGAALYPLPEGVGEVTALEQLVGFDTGLGYLDVVAFYQDEMPAAGWTPVDEALIFEDTALLTYSRGDMVVTINIDGNGEGGTTSVLISP